MIDDLDANKVELAPCVSQNHHHHCWCSLWIWWWWSTYLWWCWCWLNTLLENSNSHCQDVIFSKITVHNSDRLMLKGTHKAVQKFNFFSEIKLNSWTPNYTPGKGLLVRSDHGVWEDGELHITIREGALALSWSESLWILSWADWLQILSLSWLTVNTERGCSELTWAVWLWILSWSESANTDLSWLTKNTELGRGV